LIKQATIPIHFIRTNCYRFVFAIMMSPEEFYEKWHGYFKTWSTPKQFRKYGPRYDDDEFMDVLLLIVLDDMPVKVSLNLT